MVFTIISQAFPTRWCPQWKKKGYHPINYRYIYGYIIPLTIDNPINYGYNSINYGYNPINYTYIYGYIIPLTMVIIPLTIYIWLDNPINYGYNPINYR